ncbi:MAG: hypothetical protein ACTSV9_04480 [Candidatus Thorarchaeota archaeon]
MLTTLELLMDRLLWIWPLFFLGQEPRVHRKAVGSMTKAGYIMGPMPPHNEPFLTAEERLQRAKGCAVLCCVVIILMVVVGIILKP